jgi:alkylated DNA repair protein (DNA oxidative demethylase)
LATATLPESDGLEVHKGALNIARQRLLAAATADIIALAPLYTPAMPATGKPMSVKMTNCGALGWVTDRDGGYRYQAAHPATGLPWPPIPALVMELWTDFAGYPAQPEACLVNVYSTKARMGLHHDADEETFDAPVVSISLGDDCLFRVGGTVRGGPTRAFRLGSGDVVVLAGKSRLAYHGVDRIYPATSPLVLPAGARINLTLRRVTVPEQAG